MASENKKIIIYLQNKDAGNSLERYLHYCGPFSGTEIINDLNVLLNNSLNKKIHLICPILEKEKDLDKIIEGKEFILAEDIKPFALLLKYLDSAQSSTLLHIIDANFLKNLTKRIKALQKDNRPYCSLEGFHHLVETYIEVSKKMMGCEYKPAQEWKKNGVINRKLVIDELIRVYKESLQGDPEKGGHGVRRDLDLHFSTDEEIAKEHEKKSPEIGKSAQEQWFTLLTRDFAKNIADNVWEKGSNFGDINVLIVDDRPDLFKDELSYIKNCFPKFYYNTDTDYEKYLNIEASNTLVNHLSKFNFILIDLLFDRKNIGFKIVRELTRLKKENQNFGADIFVLSRSTNTNDIQRALNEGACGYIFKNRIFSMPYRLCEVLLQKEEEEHEDLLDYIEPFSSLKRLPLKVIKKLKSSHLEGTKEDRKWIEDLPKADLHCHLGGAMDAEITLRLALNVVRDTVLAFRETASFITEYQLRPKIEIEKDREDRYDLNKEEFLKLIYLIERVTAEIKTPILSNEFKYSFENHFELITQSISGIKLYQVISFFLVQLAISDHIKFSINNTEPKSFPSIAGLSLYIKVNCGSPSIIRPALDRPKKDLLLNKLLEATHGKPYEECGGMGLAPFLMGIFYTGSAVLQTKENLEEVAKYICEKAVKDNVKYMELRCTPGNFTRGNLSEGDVLEILKRAFDNFETDDAKKKPIVQLIVVGKRHGKEEDLKKNISLVVGDAIKQQASENVEEEAEEIKTSVCGFDLAGEEAFYDPRLFRENFRGLFDSCIPLTIHAGEETDVSRIWQAVYELHADRIGHGLSLGKESESAKGLISRFRDQKVCIELCPTSNFLTKGFRLPRTPYTLKSQPPWNHFQDIIKEIIDQNINELNKMKTENETKKEIEQWEELKEKIQDEKYVDNKIAFKGVMDDQERQKLLSLMPGGCDRKEYEKAISSLFKRSNMDAYPLKYFLKQKLQVTINTDDPAICGSNLSNEYLFASELFHASFAKEKNEDKEKDKKARRHLTKWEVLKLIKMGFKHAFLDADSRRKLIREVDESIYDKILEDEKME